MLTLPPRKGQLTMSNSVKLEYNSQEESSFGYYRCPDCGSEFYGGCDAIHRSTCTRKGYDGLTHVFGPEQIQMVLRRSATLGGDDWGCGGITLNDLREQCPDVLATFENP